MKKPCGERSRGRYSKFLFCVCPYRMSDQGNRWKGRNRQSLFLAPYRSSTHTPRKPLYWSHDHLQKIERTHNAHAEDTGEELRGEDDGGDHGQDVDDLVHPVL